MGRRRTNTLDEFLTRQFAPAEEARIINLSLKFIAREFSLNNEATISHDVKRRSAPL